MSDPIRSTIPPAGLADAGRPGGVTSPRSGGAAGGADFQSFLLDSLERVNSLQSEAKAGVEKLLTGQTDNVAEVLSAVRKADVAFSLLMEIRNKLLDVYNEIKQMRV